MKKLVCVALLGFASAAAAENCVIDLKADDQMKFDQTEVTVAASCKTVQIKLAHIGKLPATAMGHNVVIALTADIQPVSMDGQKAGAAANYVAADDKRVIAHTSVIGGGAATTASFPGSALKAGTDYSFFCSFPGHWAIMKGKLTVK